MPISTCKGYSAFMKVLQTKEQPQRTRNIFITGQAKSMITYITMSLKI